MSSHACAFVNPSCKYFPKYKASNSREQRIASSHACAFVNPSCKYFTKLTKYKASNSREQRIASCHIMQSTESPILFRSCPHCGHETPFSDQKEASKIGDSVLWSHACAFVNPSCKYFTKYKASNSREQRIASCDSANELKTIATFGQSGVVTYTQLVSLSRGSEIAQFMLATLRVRLVLQGSCWRGRVKGGVLKMGVLKMVY
jgi:hypothetical protein